MTYKGKEIEGAPTLEMIRDYIDSKHYVISAKKVLEHYTKKGWVTKDGSPIIFLEKAINGCNGNPKQYRRSYNECKEDYKRLRDTEEWKTFSIKVKAHYGYVCKKCGSIKSLNAHHLRYHMNALPWEYSMDEMIVLCSECHKEEHNPTFSNVIKTPPRYIEKSRYKAE